MITTTPWARDILTRSLEAARRFNAEVVIRVVPARAGIEAALAEGPEEGDAPLEVEGVFVAAGMEGLLDGEEPHERLVLRPAGSDPNPRP